MPTRRPVRARYEELAAEGVLQPDSSQRQLASRLDDLLDELAERALGTKKSSLGWLFSRSHPKEPVRGVYIWGAVGRGKTLLMDLFFEAARGGRKRRAHFHEFMNDVHERLNARRRRIVAGEVSDGDPIPPVAEELSADLRLLCFDEFSVTDIADAMILGRLFEQLFARGVTVVATSNVPPEDLYKDGLNRALFLPFIAMLKERMEPFQLEAPRDFRLDPGEAEPVYLTPPGQESARKLDQHFQRLTGQKAGKPLQIPHKGRAIAVPEAAGRVARFRFQELCGRPLAASDYLKLADSFDTIIVSDIPTMTDATRNEAKRFINLVDALYDNNVQLIASAAAPPADLWRGTSGAENFEFARTASRLMEMQSLDYLQAGRGAAAGGTSGGATTVP